jgi:hypothetical protein
MKLGAEPKKIAALAALLAVAGYVFYSNLISSEGGPPAARPAAAVNPQPAVMRDLDPPTPAEPRPSASSRTRSLEFRPTLRRNRADGGPDPFATDPTLRTDLLAQVQQVKLEGGERNLFQFGPPPAPKPIEPKIIPKPIGPAPPPDTKPQEAASKPPPTPIPLKFYGYASEGRAGQRRAFFLDGDDILVAAEGEVLKRRYKIVRIGVNSCVVEDVEQKHQQTLPLEEQVG